MELSKQARSYLLGEQVRSRSLYLTEVEAKVCQFVHIAARGLGLPVHRAERNGRREEPVAAAPPFR
jgi:hypothetical protein